MILKPHPVSSDRFDFDRTTNILAADASTLGFAPGQEFARVYDDACDVGLTVVSTRTGREVVYAVETEFGREGEILYWVLAPADPRERRSGLPVLHVFND